jgi:hypothetical protein
VVHAKNGANGIAIGRDVAHQRDALRLADECARLLNQFVGDNFYHFDDSLTCKDTIFLPYLQMGLFMAQKNGFQMVFESRYILQMAKVFIPLSLLFTPE